MSKYYNPYQATDLKLPKSYQEEANYYTKSSGTNRSPSRSPFPRIVDLWFLSLCIGAREQKKSKLSDDEVYKFMDGTILATDPWRIELISLLAIAYTENPEIIKEPSKVIQLCNELAASGLPDVLQMLKEGRSDSTDPIWNISDSVRDMIQQDNMS